MQYPADSHAQSTTNLLSGAALRLRWSAADEKARVMIGDV
jgi:hypothetical protein